MYTRHTAPPEKTRQDWQTIRYLLPFVWVFRSRALLALALLFLAKLANVGVPLALKEIVDYLDSPDLRNLALPVTLLLAYGILRLGSSAFNELRDVVFARVRHGIMRRLSLDFLHHLHTLSLRFHLERRTGAVTRDLERGTRSASTLLNYLLFNILPTLVEVCLIATILLVKYDPWFAVITFFTVVIYMAFTFAITNWRMKFRHQMNALDSQANSQAIDSLLNFETVKYFNNEQYEYQRYDHTLHDWEDMAVKTQTSLSSLNIGQGAIIACGVTLIMTLAARGVIDGSLTLGDLVLVNAFMLQMFIPLNFLGVVYTQLKHALADMAQMFALLHQPAEIVDRADARPLQVGEGDVCFENVDFAYQPERPILHDVNFSIPAGHKIAVVGPSGSGKSTLARLLFRFYEVGRGRILINGEDIREVSQQSLREAIGIVPQDTVLFNDTLYHNIAYARPGASIDEVQAVARMAQIHDFIDSLPQGYETVVGERGLKLSGGEKQRVAIARALLKKPRILIFDEATSSLDSASEQAILGALDQAARDHTTLVIAHRLSTIVDADEIIVLEAGRIIERGTHRALLESRGRYAQLWTMQQEERSNENTRLTRRDDE